ncbi:MAG: LPP20 family lipoprotein [Deltaproteobacteria bacterium]|nr:LPP20 family lipoprotein [Deltaproteobacteria bacterium]
MIGLGAIFLLAASAAAQPPGWVHRQPHPKFPASGYLVGLGSSSITGDEKRDAEAAEASARKDILAQIQVSVKSESEAFEKEETKNGQTFDTARFSERTEQTVSGSLEGARIVDTFVDSDADVRYALAVVSRSDAAESQKSLIEASNKSIREAFEKAGAATNGDLALRALVSAYSDAEKTQGNVVLYRALTRATIQSLRPSDVREKVAAWSASLKLAVSKGNSQPATTGQPLAEPIVFSLLAGAVPVPEVVLRLGLDGPGKVEPTAKTSADGTATVKVSEVGSTGAPEQHLVAEVDWAGWLVDRNTKVRASDLGLTPLEARASYSFKTVATTRVAIVIDEKIVWKDAAKTEAPASPVFAPRITALLSAKGFDVRPVAGLTAAQLLAPAEIKTKLSGEAEVLLTGTITSEFMNRMCDKCPSFYKAVGSLRAVDTRTGQLVAEIHEPGKKGVGTSDTSAGGRALEESAKERAVEIVEALLKALGR